PGWSGTWGNRARRAGHYRTWPLPGLARYPPPGRSDPAWAGSLEGTRGRWGLLAFPDLRLADEGDAAGNLQLPASLDQLHLGLVDLALVRLEDGAAGVLAAALGLHAADDLHPGDRLALAVVLALVARRIRLGRIDQLD